MTPPDLLEVGRIDKPHGVRGDVLVTLTTNREERVAVGAELESDRGWLTVARSRPHQRRWIVGFEEVADRDAAEELRGVVLRATPIDDPDELWVHELIGCTLRDADDVDRGVVEAVEENAASDLLVLDTGQLVPVRFVVGRPDDGVVRAVTPPGLFDAAAEE